MLVQLGKGLSAHRSSGSTIPSIINNNPQTVALFGDSLVGQHTRDTATNKMFENIGWFNVVNYKMNDRFNFELSHNLGISGNTTVQMAARKADMLASNADIYFVQGGTNDISLKTSPTIIKNALSEIYDYISNTLGAKVYAMTILPRSYWQSSFTPAEIAQAKLDIIDVNNWIKQKPNITVIDAYAAWDDGNNEPLFGYTSDGLHCSPIGANAIADSIINIMRPRYGNGGSLTLTDNLFTNGNFGGTGATLPNGCSGVFPSSFSLQTIGGTSNNNWRVFSKTMDDHLQIHLNVPQSNGEVGIIVHQRVTLGNDYDTLTNLQSACEMDIVSVAGDVTNATYEIRHEGGPEGIVYYSGMDDHILKIPAYGKGICAVPEIDPTGSTTLRGRAIIQGDTTNGPIDVTVILKAMVINQI